MGGACLYNITMQHDCTRMIEILKLFEFVANVSYQRMKLRIEFEEFFFSSVKQIITFPVLISMKRKDYILGSSRTGERKYIPGILWGVITCPCLFIPASGAKLIISSFANTSHHGTHCVYYGNNRIYKKLVLELRWRCMSACYGFIGLFFVVFYL